jgi:hypothetical protein
MNLEVADSRAKYERLRYITENFQSQQGLTWVALGALSFLTSSKDIFGITLPWWFWLLIVPFGIAAFRYIPKYYGLRFGSVEPRYPSNTHVVIFLIALLVLAVYGGSIGRYADSVVQQVSNKIHGMISDPGQRANLSPILFWAVLMFAGLARRPKDLVRARLAFDFACLLFWTVVLAFFPLRHPDVTHLTLWRILDAGWSGISLIIVGLYEHLTFLYLVPARFRASE